MDENIILTVSVKITRIAVQKGMLGLAVIYLLHVCVADWTVLRCIPSHAAIDHGPVHAGPVSASTFEESCALGIIPISRPGAFGIPRARTDASGDRCRGGNKILPLESITVRIDSNVHLARFSSRIDSRRAVFVRQCPEPMPELMREDMPVDTQRDNLESAAAAS